MPENLKPPCLHAVGQQSQKSQKTVAFLKSLVVFQFDRCLRAAERSQQVLLLGSPTGEASRIQSSCREAICRQIRARHKRLRCCAEIAKSIAAFYCFTVVISDRVWRDLFSISCSIGRRSYRAVARWIRVSLHTVLRAEANARKTTAPVHA